MKILSLLLLMTFPLYAREKVEHTARVTYYWANSSGQVGTKTSTGVKARPHKTIAVDPKIIPYGSFVEIPKLGVVYTAQDTGSAVVSKKASKGKTIVVDVFCSSKEQAQNYIKNYPMYMKIIVYKSVN